MLVMDLWIRGYLFCQRASTKITGGAKKVAGCPIKNLTTGFCHYGIASDRPTAGTRIFL
jgi:hypothetical protein